MSHEDDFADRAFYVGGMQDGVREVADVYQRKRCAGRRHERKDATPGKAEEWKKVHVARPVDADRPHDYPGEIRDTADDRLTGELAESVRGQRIRLVVFPNGDGARARSGRALARHVDESSTDRARGFRD